MTPGTVLGGGALRTVVQNAPVPRLVSLEWLRALIALAAWAGAGLSVLVFAARIDIGPVVFSLSHNHGVHALDLLAGVVAAMAATIVSVLVYVFIPAYALSREPGRRGPF